MKEPELYDVLKGKIKRIKEYGAFVQLENFESQGLVHKTQISNYAVENVSDVLEEGQKIFCKGGKLGLSMKYVNQTSGEDNDKNNVQLGQEELRRKSRPDNRQQPIELGAVLNTTCRKCGGTGHMSKDCFHTLGGPSFDLLPDEPPASISYFGTAAVSDSNKPHKSAKKKRDHSSADKRQHRRRSSSSNSSSNGPTSSKRRHKESKKKKKDKKRDRKKDKKMKHKK